MLVHVGVHFNMELFIIFKHTYIYMCVSVCVSVYLFAI